jgi:hypothetical protein
MSIRNEGRCRAVVLRRWLVAFGAVFTLVAVPGALAASITPANGRDFILPDNNVYQLSPNGVYHLIPDVPTANAMGIVWNKLSQVSSVSPVGGAFASVLPPAPVRIVAPTTKANGMDYLLPNGSVFQRDAKGVYHWIPDVTTANAMGVTWTELRRATSVSPVGGAIKSVIVRLQPACATRLAPATMANGKDYIVPPNNTVYQRDLGGVYHLIPDIATGNAMGLKWRQLKKVTSVSPIGPPIRSICTG